MPDVKTFEQIAQGHGVGVALLVIGCLGLVAAVSVLYRENRALYTRIELLLKERVSALEHMLQEERSEPPRSSRR